MEAFQAQALEIHAKIEKEKQGLISKLEIIQTYFQEIRRSLGNILLKERETKESKATFQKAVTLSAKEEIGKTHSYLFQNRSKGM